MIPKQKKLHKFLLYYRLFLEVVLGVRRYYVQNVPEGGTIVIDQARLGLLYVSEGSSGVAALYLISYIRASLVYPESTPAISVTKDSDTRLYHPANGETPGTAGQHHV